MIIWSLAIVLAAQALAPLVPPSRDPSLTNAFEEPRSSSGATSPIIVGSRVRFKAPGVVSGRVQGIVVDRSATALTIVVDQAPLLVERNAVTELDMSTGRRRRWAEGLLLGVAAGVAIGYATNVEDCFRSTIGIAPTFDPCTRSEAITYAMFFTAPIGTGLGYAFRTDHWKRMPLESLRVGLVPARGRGARFSIALGW